MELPEKIDNGKIIDLKYRDLGKNALMLCENARKKYPIVWIPIPSVWTHLSICPDFIMKDSAVYPIHITKNPILIEKNARVSLKRVGLPVFLYPIYDITPIVRPTRKPIKFRIFSRMNSNYAHHLYEQIKFFSKFIPTHQDYQTLYLLFHLMHNLLKYLNMMNRSVSPF